jgi:hypothetical protein
MRVVIAGGHGKIALWVERLLAARGDSATALVRNPDHHADVLEAGGIPVHCDLKKDEQKDWLQKKSINKRLLKKNKKEIKKQINKKTGYKRKTVSTKRLVKEKETGYKRKTVSTKKAG